MGAERQAGKSSCWGVAAEYLYGGSLDTNLQSTLPVALGGCGDLVGSFDTATLFLAAYSNWKF